jgi:hypothetical protein
MKLKFILTFLFVTFIIQAQILTPVFPTSNNDGLNFGNALSIDENNVLYVANRTSVQSGNIAKVFRFTLNGNVVQQTHAIVPSDALASDSFGADLDCTTTHLAVGSPFHDMAGTNAGAVYIYNNDSNSNLIQKITPTDAASNDNFGKAVVLYNNFLFISSNSVNPTNTSFNGAVYIYSWNGTSFQFLQKLQSTLVNKFGAKPYVINQRLFLASNPSADISPTYSLPLTYEWNGNEWMMTNYTFNFSTPNTNLNTLVDLTSLGNQLCGIFSSTNNALGYRVCLFSLSGNMWQETNSFQPNIGDFILNRIQTLNNRIIIGTKFYLLQMSRKYPVWIYSLNNNTYSLENTIYGNGPDLTDDGFGSTMESNATNILIGANREFTTQTFGKAYFTDSNGLNTSSLTSESIVLFPNPATNQITLSSTIIPSSITVFDTLGKSILTTKSSLTLPITSLAPGIYFFQALFENGSIFLSKFIKN